MGGGGGGGGGQLYRGGGRGHACCIMLTGMALVRLSKLSPLSFPTMCGCVRVHITMCFNVGYKCIGCGK